MDERDLNIWELLGRKLTGEANSQELERLERLLNEEENTKEIQQFEDDLETYWKEVEGHEEEAEFQRRTVDYKNQMMEKISPESLPDNRQKKISFYRSKKLWRSVAVIAVFLVGGWFVYQSLTAHQRNLNTVTTKAGSKTKIMLPDGTKVWLNADSKLTYPNDFQHISKREVTLVGEAYFKVKHDADHPFVIHTKGLTVRDIGTEFNLKAYPDDEKSSLSLIEGSVSVSLINDKDKDLILKPGEKVVYHTTPKTKEPIAGRDLCRKKTHKKNIETLSEIESLPKLKVTKIHPVLTENGKHLISETAWKDDKLVFKGTRFEELARQLSRWYGVEITIKDKKIADYTFTGIFENETLDQAMKELQMVRPFEFNIKNKHVTIYNSSP